MLTIPHVAALIATLILFSSAFQAGQPIPRRFTCDGQGTPPPLAWTAPPKGTRSFALRMYDPDARGFVHWLAWGIPAAARAVEGAREGTNDFGRRGYGGPCPPPGTTHRYVFVLYALARPLRLATGARAPAFTAAVRTAGVLRQATLTGTYRRG